ncbi:MAG: lytic transglycosylase domain-containing protein [Deltaproteobacteria bacterium]|nr:lytic transglycosylase domain-containing protein [Deltaproteobacteria bacterium]
MNNQYDHLIRQFATRPDFPPHFVKGMIHVESAFRADARGPGGELGLMQFLASTAKTLGVDHASLVNPEAAIRAGTRYIAQIIDKYVTPNLKVPIHPQLRIRFVQFAYNAGPLFTVRLLKRFGADAATLSSPGSFNRMVDTLKGDPDVLRLQKLTREADFLAARKKVVERYQYWAGQYAKDFGTNPGANPPAAVQASMPLIPLAIVGAAYLIWKRK